MKDETLDWLDRVTKGLAQVSNAIRHETNEVVASGDHIEVIKHFNQVRLAAEQIKECREALNDMSDNLSRVTIPDIIANLKERTGEKPPFNIEGVGRVSVSYRFSASMVDKEAAFAWLRGHGHEGIIQETVNSSTLSAFAKNLLETDGIELPPEAFKVGTSPYTSITKAK